MALLTNIEKFLNTGTALIRKLNAATLSFMIKMVKNIFNWKPFGSADREIPGKVSQSIQFSPEAIKELKLSLSKEF